MRKKTYFLTIAAFLTVAMLYLTVDTTVNPVQAGPPKLPPGHGPGELGVVYVESQGLFFDTFVSADPLPYRGRFQKLEDGVTMYGPGDPGYLGGRWWIDANENGEMDPPGEDGDVYLLCPLLPPGRETMNP